MLSSASDHPATRSPCARLGRGEILLLAAWCGAAGGLLEVATRILCRAINPTNRLYLMTRHFVWLAPLSNLLFFSVAGLGLALAAGCGRGGERGYRPASSALERSCRPSW